MLAAIFYGSQYGGTISTVLLNVPGEASSVITMMDGHEMAKRGRPGWLSIAALGSFFGGTVATVGLVLFAPAPRCPGGSSSGCPSSSSSSWASRSASGSPGSVLKSLMVAVFGMLISLVGLDAVQGVPRFTFGRASSSTASSSSRS